MQGKNWAFVAPYSGKVKQLDDMVTNLSLEIQPHYKNFSGQVAPTQMNGFDIAFGQFTGTNQEGEQISLAIVGIAAPGGRYFVAESRISQNDAQALGPELSSMLQSLRFSGQ